jgi:hypothetical protein
MSKACNAFPEITISGELSRKCDDSEIAKDLRQQYNLEARFPINLANRLREAFLKGGLHIFKGTKGIQFVNVARLQPLTGDANLISDTVRVILDYLKGHPRADRKSLSEAVHSKIEALLGVSSADSSQALREGIDSNKGVSMTPTAQRMTEDLHWLIRQGHVIEYHLGGLELAKEPPAKIVPVKPTTDQATNSEVKAQSQESHDEANPIAELPPPRLRPN